MNEENLKVLTNIIGAVESGGQVYGKRRYDAYEPPYKNSPKEHTITIGWAQCYGHEARKLIKGIFEADVATFWRLDTADIEEMLSYDWEAIRWKPTAKEKAAIIALIDSPVGHEVQDKLFAEKMEKLIADCESEYTADVKAQMMYCEIRHLGGKGPCDRIFKRCNGKYDLDTILMALVRDQRDLTSDNQVGDTRYWSRHVKCKEFIDRYAVEEVEQMAVVIGSARGDEHGNATGGVAGDQKQTSADDWRGEVSKQNWYLHSKGWYVVRAYNATVREKIARDMEYACENRFIGYDQSQNRTLYSVAEPYGFDCSKVKTACETDCAQLVRVCVRYAGINCGDFYTATLVDTLRKTGAFEVLTSDKYCKSSRALRRGDILCTRVKGHTVVVLSDGADSDPEPQADSAVTKFQKFLNQNYAQMLKSFCGELLEVDGEYGPRTKGAAVTVWKYMANKYVGSNLTLGNLNFFATCKKAASKVTDSVVAVHPTFGYLIQGVLAGRGFYSANLDGVCGAKTKAAIQAFQKARGLKETGSMDADTWYSMFN